MTINRLFPPLPTRKGTPVSSLLLFLGVALVLIFTVGINARAFRLLMEHLGIRHRGDDSPAVPEPEEDLFERRD